MKNQQDTTPLFLHYFLENIKNWWRANLDWLSSQMEIIPACNLLESSSSSDNILAEIEFKMGKR